MVKLFSEESSGKPYSKIRTRVKDNICAFRWRNFLRMVSAAEARATLVLVSTCHFGTIHPRAYCTMLPEIRKIYIYICIRIYSPLTAPCEIYMPRLEPSKRVKICILIYRLRKTVNCVQLFLALWLRFSYTSFFPFFLFFFWSQVFLTSNGCLFYVKSGTDWINRLKICLSVRKFPFLSFNIYFPLSLNEHARARAYVIDVKFKHVRKLICKYIRNVNDCR